MGLTYYDPEAGRNRIKRRYLWAGSGYLLGILTILMVLALF